MKSFRFSLSYKVWGLVCRCVFYMEEHLSIRTSHIARAQYPRVVSVATVLDNRALEILNFKMQIGKTSTVLRRSWTPFSVCLSRHSCFGALLSLPLCCSSSLSCANAHPPHTLSLVLTCTHTHTCTTLSHTNTQVHTHAPCRYGAQPPGGTSLLPPAPSAVTLSVGRARPLCPSALSPDTMTQPWVIAWTALTLSCAPALFKSERLHIIAFLQAQDCSYLPLPWSC